MEKINFQNRNVRMNPVAFKGSKEKLATSVVQKSIEAITTKVPADTLKVMALGTGGIVSAVAGLNAVKSTYHYEDENGKRDYKYDGKGRTLEEAISDTNGTLQKKNIYAYQEGSNQAEKVVETYCENGNKETYYDNKLIKITLADGFTISGEGEELTKEQVEKAHEEFVTIKSELKNSLVSAKSYRRGSLGNSLPLYNSDQINEFLSNINTLDQAKLASRILPVRDEYDLLRKTLFEYKNSIIKMAGSKSAIDFINNTLDNYGEDDITLDVIRKSTTDARKDLVNKMIKKGFSSDTTVLILNLVGDNEHEEKNIEKTLKFYGHEFTTTDGKVDRIDSFTLDFILNHDENNSIQSLQEAEWFQIFNNMHRNYGGTANIAKKVSAEIKTPEQKELINKIINIANERRDGLRLSDLGYLLMMMQRPLKSCESKDEAFARLDKEESNELYGLNSSYRTPERTNLILDIYKNYGLYDKDKWNTKLPIYSMIAQAKDEDIEKIKSLIELKDKDNEPVFSISEIGDLNSSNLDLVLKLVTRNKTISHYDNSIKWISEAADTEVKRKFAKELIENSELSNNQIYSLVKYASSPMLVSFAKEFIDNITNKEDKKIDACDIGKNMSVINSPDDADFARELIKKYCIGSEAQIDASMFAGIIARAKTPEQREYARVFLEKYYLNNDMHLPMYDLTIILEKTTNPAKFLLAKELIEKYCTEGISGSKLKDICEMIENFNAENTDGLNNLLESCNDTYQKLEGRTYVELTKYIDTPEKLEKFKELTEYKARNEKGEIVPVFTSDDLIQMFKNLAETGNEIDTGLETYSIEEANNKIEHFNSDKTKGEVVVQKHANGSKTIYVDGVINRQINSDGSLEYFNPKNMLFEVTFPDGYTIKRKGEYISKEEVNKMHEKFVEEKARIKNNLIKLKAAKMPFHLKDSTDIDFILSQITNDEQLERIDIMIGQHAFYNTCG